MSVDAGLGSGVANEDGLSICIVNNMPGAVLRRTEQQFRDVIGAAAPQRRVELRFFSLPDPRRGETTQAYIKAHYEDLSSLLLGDCDGLIVTGTEPRTALLRQEPFWPALTALIEWAKDNTNSVLFLCLAAHAAVLHLDGIERRPLQKKLFGTFACGKTRDDGLLAGCPADWNAPHSRSNDLLESDLISAGYSILSRSAWVGADIFSRQSGGRSHFTFMQGHLEYDATSLLDEYRREVSRFLTGKRTIYPEPPVGYFDSATEDRLAGVQDRVMASRDIGLIDALARSAEMKTRYDWRPLTIQIYANWIQDLAQRKASLPHGRQSRTRQDAVAMSK